MFARPAPSCARAGGGLGCIGKTGWDLSRAVSTADATPPAASKRRKKKKTAFAIWKSEFIMMQKKLPKGERE